MWGRVGVASRAVAGLAGVALVTAGWGLATAGCALVPPGRAASASSVPVSSTSPDAPAPTAPTAPTASRTPAKPVATLTPGRTPTVAVTRNAPTDTPFTVDGVVLVNRNHPLSSAYVPPSSGNRDGLSAELNAALDRMFADAARQGLTLTVRSGYRSYAEQAQSYAQAQAKYDQGTVDRFFAKPGTSEHQTGLSADLSDASGGPGYAFKGTPEQLFVAAHAADYGLIIRYPEGGTAITGYEWESWHVRYVGPEIAAYIAQHPGLTLEEYLGEA